MQCPVRQASEVEGQAREEVIPVNYDQSKMIRSIGCLRAKDRRQSERSREVRASCWYSKNPMERFRVQLRAGETCERIYRYGMIAVFNLQKTKTMLVGVRSYKYHDACSPVHYAPATAPPRAARRRPRLGRGGSLATAWSQAANTVCKGPVSHRALPRSIKYTYSTQFVFLPEDCPVVFGADASRCGPRYPRRNSGIKLPLERLYCDSPGALLSAELVG
jgi:hypothetical protein